jgi:dTDP-glucose 4,6-dehydratase
LVSSYVRTYNLNAVITNCSNNYGPKQHPEKLIPKLIYNILNNRPLPIYGKGTNSREWIYVKDHCEALIKVFKNGKRGHFYNIGSNKNLNNLEVTKKILAEAKNLIPLRKKVQIKFVKDRPGHDLRYALNSDKIKSELGWYPKINFSKGIKLTLDWYLENKSYYKSISKKDIVNRLGKS